MKNRIAKLALVLIIQGFLLLLALEFIDIQGAYNSRFNTREDWTESLKK